MQSSRSYSASEPNLLSSSYGQKNETKGDQKPSTYAESAFVSQVPRKVVISSEGERYLTKGEEMFGAITGKVSSVVSKVMNRAVEKMTGERLPEKSVSVKEHLVAVMPGVENVIKFTLRDNIQNEILKGSLAAKCQQLHESKLSSEKANLVKDLFNVVDKKFDFYKNQRDGVVFSEGLVRSLLGCLDSMIEQNENNPFDHDHFNNMVQRFSLLVYGHPELVDYEALDAFLDVAQKTGNNVAKKIYAHFEDNILSSQKQFNEILHPQYIDNYKSVDGVCNFISFLGMDVPSENANELTSIKQFDQCYMAIRKQFEKMEASLFKNPIDSEKSNEMLKAAATFTKVIFEKGMLDGKLDVDHFTFKLDHMLVMLQQKMRGNTQEIFLSLPMPSDKASDARHFQAVQDVFPKLMYEHCSDIEKIIENIDLESDANLESSDKKATTEKMLSALSTKLEGSFIHCLDKMIEGILQNLDVSVEEEGAHREKWILAANAILESADAAINEDFQPGSMEYVRSRVDVRREIINGFVNISCDLKNQLPGREQYLYQGCVKRIMLELATQLDKTDFKDSKDKSRGIADKLTEVFNITKSKISSMISLEEEHFQKTLVGQFVEFAKAHKAQKANKTDGIELKSINSKGMPTMDDLARYKDYLQMMVGIAQSKEQSNNSANLLAAVTNSSDKSPKRIDPIREKIHEYTMEQVKDLYKKSWGDTFKFRHSVFEIGRHENNLAPSENFRKHFYFDLQPETIRTTLELSALALQQSKLEFVKKMQEAMAEDKSAQNNGNIYNNSTYEAISFFNKTITKLMKAENLDTLNLFSIISAAITTITPENQKAVEHIDQIINAHKANLSAIQHFCHLNYNRADTGNWKDDVDVLWNKLGGMPGKAETKEQKIANTLINCMVNSLCEAFANVKAEALAPSIEIVTLYQSLVACRLMTDAPAFLSDEDLTPIKFAICKYNDHFKSLEEQMAHKCCEDSSESNQILADNIEKSFASLKDKLRDNAVNKLLTEFENIGADDPEVIEKIINELSQLSENKFFGSLSKKTGKLWSGIVKLLNENQPACMSGFFCVALLNMIYMSKGTLLMHSLQQSTPAIAGSLFNLSTIFSQLTKTNSALQSAADTVFQLSRDAAANGETCLSRIAFNNMGAATNATLASSISNAQDNTLSAMREIFYSDATGCPSGGIMIFSTGNVNWPNLFSTTVNAITSAASCTGWGLDSRLYKNTIYTHPSLSVLLQDFTPKMNEELLKLTAKKQNPAAVDQGLDTIIYNSYSGRTMAEFFYDTFDLVLNKDVPFDKKLSAGFAGFMMVRFIKYFSIGPLGMMIPDRPHSLEELQKTVDSHADSRVIYSLLRMVGYGTMKEFMDVFSTKASTLAFLVVLKECDFFNTSNEKMYISKFASIRTLYARVEHALATISKKGSVQDSFQMKVLNGIYGENLMKELLGKHPEITKVITESQILTSNRRHRAAGISAVVSFAALQMFNLYKFTYIPAVMASAASSSWGSVATKAVGGVTKEEIQYVIDGAKKTVSKEFQPNNLSVMEKFWHGMFSVRGQQVMPQLTLLWTLKQLVIWGMKFNATANETSYGVSTRNWEVYAATIAYALKDSTGMMARFGILAGSEIIRTGFSFADKLDSPTAEIAISYFGRWNLTPPQGTIEAMNSIIEESMIKEDGDPEKVHESVGKKFKAILDIGLTSLNRLAKTQESKALEVLHNLGSSSVDKKQDLKSIKQMEMMNKGASKTARENQYFHLANQLRDELETEMPIFGKDAKSEMTAESQDAFNYIKTFIDENALGINYSDPKMLFNTLLNITKNVPEDIMELYMNSMVTDQIRSMDAHEKNEYRKQILADAGERRMAQIEGRNPDTHRIPADMKTGHLSTRGEREFLIPV